MNNRKRVLRRILCIAGVLLCLASCGRERYELKTEVSQVYKATVLELPDPDYRVSMGEGPVWNGERFSVQSFLLDKEVGGLFLDFSKTYSFLPDGTEILEEVPAPKVETVQSGSYPQDVRTFANGETLFTEVVQNGDKLRLFLSLRDDRSEPVFSVDLAGEFQFDYTRMKDGSGTFIFLNAVYDETDGECRYLVLTSEGLCAFDKNGKLLWLDDTRQNPISIADTEVGILYLYGQDYSQSLCLVDPVTGETGDSVELPEEIAGAAFYMGEGYDLYAKNNLAMWGVTFGYDDEGAVTCSYEKVIDWVNSELTPSELKDFCIADARTMTAIRHDMLTDEDGGELLLLTWVPPEEVVVKDIITLARLCSGNQGLDRAITDFNKSSETYRIVVTDYTIYDEELRKTFFDAELAAGNVPDILLFGDPNEPVVESYEKSGLLTDLLPHMDFADALLGYVTKPYIRENGAQYVFPLQPYSGTSWGSAEYFDGPITVEEALAMEENPPEGYVFWRSEKGFYNYIMEGLFHDCVDFAAGTCSFDDGRFAEVYGKIRHMMSTEQSELPTMLQNGGTGSVYSWVITRKEHGELVPVGNIPNAERKVYTGGAYAFLAVTEKSTCKAQCLDFIETYTHTKIPHSNIFFYPEDVYENLAQYDDKTIFLTPDGPKTVFDVWLEDPSLMPAAIGELSGESFKLTRADADELIAFLDSIDTSLRSDTGLFDVFWGEVWKPDERTPEEVADAIQSRASIYLAEHS